MTTFLDPQGRTIAAIDDREPEHVPTAIKVSLVDVNLVSGSSDRLRDMLRFTIINRGYGSALRIEERGHES